MPIYLAQTAAHTLRRSITTNTPTVDKKYTKYFAVLELPPDSCKETKDAVLIFN
jgi:hypothetical protein